MPPVPVSVQPEGRRSAGSPRAAGYRSQCRPKPARIWPTCTPSVLQFRRSVMLPPDGGANVRAIVDGAEDVHLDAAAEVTRLAAMPKLDYERERKQAAERLGARISALDDLVKSARAQADPASADTTGGGRPLRVAVVGPWPGAVDGAGLLDDLAQMIRRHVVLDQAAADATALWIAHT